MTARSHLRTAADAGTHTASGAVVDAAQPVSFSQGLAMHSPRDSSEGGLQLKEAPAGEPDKKPAGEEKEDLGQIEGLGKKFQKKAGGLADLCAPEPGRTGRMTVFVNVPVAAGGMVKVSFKFMGQVTRGEDGHVTTKLTVGGGVTAGKKINLYFATVDAFAAAQIFGYVEAKGESGEECMRLVALGLHTRLAKVNKSIANAVFGPETIAAALEGLDEDDYVETGLGVEAAVGGGGEIAPDKQAGGWLAGSATKGDRLSRGDDGELKTDKMKGAAVSIGTWLPPFRLMGDISTKYKNGVMESAGGAITGVAMMSIGDIEGRLLGGTFLLDAGAGMARELRKARKKMKDGESARITDEMTAHVLEKSATKLTIQGGSHAAIKALNENYAGLMIGFGLSLSISWSRTEGTTFTLSLEKQDRIDIGESFRDDLLNVRLQNIQQIFEEEL